MEVALTFGSPCSLGAAHVLPEGHKGRFNPLFVAVVPSRQACAQNLYSGT